MSAEPVLKVANGVKNVTPDRGVSGPLSPRSNKEAPPFKVAEEVLRRLVEENALKFRRHGLLLRTLKHWSLTRLAREYSWRFGMREEAVLTCCGRILSRYARPARNSRPKAYVVTSSLVSHLFGVSWEKLRERPLYSLSAVEDYYVALVIEEWGDGYGEEDEEEWDENEWGEE